MKKITQLLILAVCVFAFSSCCNMFAKGCIEGQKEISHTTNRGAKGGMPMTVTERVPVKHECTNCGSSYCPRPNCCGIISNEVTSRATGQIATGEPFIGLIPTMKTLAPKAQ